MTEIEISDKFSEEDYRGLSKLWAEADNAILDVTKLKSEDVIERVTNLLLNLIPDDFAYAVLADIAEMPLTSNRVLENIFDCGDTACKVSVCLRDNLSDSLVSRCSTTSDQEVLRHFQLRLKATKK